MIPKLKHDGYSKDGIRLYPMDGGGGGGGSTGSQTQISELPEWARGYAKSALEKASALSESPYQSYSGDRIAGFSPMQQTSYDAAGKMTTNDATGYGITGAQNVMGKALGTNYDAGKFTANQFDKSAADQYMNPYMQSVVDIQKREANKQADVQRQQQQAAGVSRGAFGGSRDALMRSEADRNLNTQLNDIQTIGSSNAYTNAQQQFNADQVRNMQAQQLGEQSRQYGAGLGMQGLQTALQGAGALGNMGQQQFQQGMDINKLQNFYGGQQQALRQQGLSQAYQDFQDERNHPYKQLGFFSDMIRGLPLGQQSTRQMYEGPGSMTGQLAGLGMGAYGVSQMMRKEGGTVSSYADGGSVDSSYNIESILSRLSDQQLQQAKQAAMNRRDVEQATLIDQEMAQRASMRNGINAAPVNADQMASDQNPDSISSFAAGGSAVSSLLAQPKEEEISVEDSALGLLEKLGARSKPAMDALNAQIEKSKGRADEIKGRGFNEALAQYGFKMAQAASKPGARFMNAAAEASPVLAESAMNTNRAVQAAEDTFTKLKMDQQKYQIALDKGDMQTAATLAGQIRQEKQASKMYGLEAAKAVDQYNNQKAQIAASAAAASRDAPFLQVVNDLARDPRNAGKSRQELMEIASKSMYGAQYAGAEQRGTAAYLKAKNDIETEYKLLPFLKKDDPLRIQQETARNRRIEDLNRMYPKEFAEVSADPSGSISSALPKEGRQGNLQKSDLDLINKYSR